MSINSKIKIRLQLNKQGSIKYYRLVCTQTYRFRNGKTLEVLGNFHITHKKLYNIGLLNTKRIYYWLAKGAHVSLSASKLLLQSGFFYDLNNNRM